MEYLVDIGSRNPYPAGALSNFSPHPFTFHGFAINSMEGFLQGLKFKSPEMQQHVFTLVGMAAKKKGSNKKWFREQVLYYQGTPFNRHSQEYQSLLDEVYEAMFTQNEKARKALLATNGAVLKHSIGKSDAHKTVLTEQEFCSRLTRIRERLKNNML
jgi:predicted NAD-dependent protein-ADP-ribosyltransferase YbiA (DUF1768 family)